MFPCPERSGSLNSFPNRKNPDTRKKKGTAHGVSPPKFPTPVWIQTTTRLNRNFRVSIPFKESLYAGNTGQVLGRKASTLPGIAGFRLGEKLPVRTFYLSVITTRRFC